MSSTSNLFGSGTSTQSTSQNNGPWGPQQAFIKNGFGQAGATFNQGYATAQPAERQAQGFAGGMGNDIATQAGTVGNFLTNGAGLYRGNAESLGNSAQNAGEQARMDLQNPVGDQTDTITADAGKIMNSSPVQQAIQSQDALIQQQLNEKTLPGLNRQAAMGGDLNSSRAGAAQAQAQEAAALAEGNVNSSLLGNAFNSGLSTATAQNLTGLNIDSAQRMAGANDKLAGIQTALGANSQIGSGVNSGLLADNVANETATNNFGLGTGAANEGLAQNGAYMGQVGGNYGSTSNLNTTLNQPGSTLGGVAGLGAGLGSLFAQGGALNSNTVGGLGSLVGGVGNWLGNLFGGSSGSSDIGSVGGAGTGVLQDLGWLNPIS